MWTSYIAAVVTYAPENVLSKTVVIAESGGPFPNTLKGYISLRERIMADGTDVMIEEASKADQYSEKIMQAGNDILKAGKREGYVKENVTSEINSVFIDVLLTYC